MKGWQYHRGEWSEIECPLPMDSGGDWDKEMKTAGFTKWDTLGEQEYYPSIEVWWRTKETDRAHGWQYYALYSLSGDGGEDIWMRDFPSLLQFLHDHAPVIQTQNVIVFNTRLRSALEKSFQLWHEHDLEEICRQCDPFEYGLQQQRRREAQEKKRQADAARSKQ